MSWAPIGFRGKTSYEPGETVEVRRLPGQKWEDRRELATYVRRIRQDEMPALWKGPLGHVVKLADGRTTTLSSVRIRKLTLGGK